MRCAQLLPAIACSIAWTLGPAPATAAEVAKPTPAKGVSVSFGKRGELVVDGKPRFIRGGYRSGDGDNLTERLSSAADAGFDLVHDYRFESMNVANGAQDYIQTARSYLRRADELGLGVFLGLPREAVKQGDEQAITQIVKALSSEHALWMWYLFDEPNPNKVSPEAVSRVHDLLRRLDPQHPAIILANKPNTAQQYQPYCDVLWVDKYPFTATGESKVSLRSQSDALKTAKGAASPGKAVWPVLQAFDNRGNPNLRAKTKKPMERPNDSNHRPNEADLRAQAHLAIANQAMAVVYYWAPEDWYSMRRDTPGVWRSLSRVLRELHDLEPVLLAPDAAGAVTMKGGGNNDDVSMWTRTKDGRIYVGVVNENVHSPANVKLDASRGGGVKQILGDGSVQATGNHYDVRLGPAGVVVFAIGAQ
jgi:hypothetical protein